MFKASFGKYIEQQIFLDYVLYNHDLPSQKNFHEVEHFKIRQNV